MNIYILLPFVEVRYDPDYIKSTGKLTRDYAAQFKFKEDLYYIHEGSIGKRSRYSEPYGGEHWTYTMIQPQTLKLL